MSSLRSCALLVGQKYRVRFSSVMERVRQLSGVDITILVKDAETQVSEADIRRVLEVLVQIKNSGYDPPVE